jgi:hypothetical protein
MTISSRFLKRLLLFALVVLLVLQFVGPARTNPASDPANSLATKVTIPPDVNALLTRACRDCHSNATRWPWYAYVAPVSWLVISDVNHGREHYNLSNWTETSEEGADLLDEMCQEVKEGKMPLPRYLLMHSEAKLTDADRKLLCDWSNAAAAQMAESSPPEPQGRKPGGHTHTQPH